MSSPATPKAVLYYFPLSIWSATALLALEEKGYGDDEVDRKIVDLWSGAHYGPSFLRLNPKATVPTLVVPLQKTLSKDVESRYKAITETKEIVEFLDKSRSAMSQTRTTSLAPAPALAPATIAAFTISTKIIDILHSEEGSPNTLSSLNARDHTSLKVLAAIKIPSLEGRQRALAGHISDAESGLTHISEKVQNFWRDKKAGVEELLDVFLEAEKADDELSVAGGQKREEYFAKAKEAWEVNLKNVLISLDQEVVGPFALGDQLSVADLHLAAWMARLVKLSGGSAADNGSTAVGKLESHIGGGFALSKDFQPPKRQLADRARKESKLATFWDTMRNLTSWKKVYAAGLY